MTGRYRKAQVVGVLGVALLLAACGSSSTKSSTPTTASGGGTSNTTGAASASPTGTPILIGTLEDQTGGSVAGTSTQGVDTMNAWVKWTNAHGGILGHPVKLVWANDNSDPAQAHSSLETLVNQDHIVALVGQNAEATEPTWDDFMKAAGVPVIGGAGYTTAWFTNPMFYPVTTTVISNVWAITYAGLQAGHSKQALLQCNNSTVCLSAIPLIKSGAKSQGVNLVYSETASATAASYLPECLSMKSSGATAVIPTVNNQLLARNCAQQNFHPVWIGSNADTTPAQLRATPEFNNLIGAVNTFPFWQSFPQTETYFQAMQQYAPAYMKGGSKSDTLSIVSPAAWASGVVFAKAITNAAVPAGSIVTRADLIRGLSMIQNSTNGGYTPPVSYGNGTTPSAQVTCFWLYHVENAAYVSTNGLNTSCEPQSDLPKA